MATITNKEILFYFFSHNYINSIISNLLNDIQMTDIDFLSYYINFLRTISLKLTIQSLNLFFNQGLNSFPLLDNSLLLFNHPDVMIQNVSRTIFLSILKFSYPPLIDYICFLPQINIFIKIVIKFNNMIYSLIQFKNNQYINEDISENINELIEEINGEILFIQDILSVGNLKINFILINSIFYIVFFNNLFKNLINNIQRNITLYIIYLFLKNIKDENFLNCLIFLLFNETIDFELKKILDEKMEFSAEHFVYNKNSSVSFDEYLKFNFNEGLFSLIGFYISNSNKYKEIKIILDSIEDYKYNDDKNVILQVVMKQLGNYFQNKKKIFGNILNFHKFISNTTGINCGFYNEQNNNILSLTTNYFKDFNWNIVNPIKKNLINLMYNVTEKNNTILNYLFLLNYIIDLEKVSKNLKAILHIHPYFEIKKEEFFDINSMCDYDDYNYPYKNNYEKPPIPVMFDKNIINDFEMIKNDIMNNIGPPPYLYNTHLDLTNNFFEKQFPLDKIQNINYEPNLIQSLLFKIQNLNDFMPILGYKLLFTILEKLIINPFGESNIEKNHLNAINNTYLNIIDSILYGINKNKNVNSELFRNAFSLFQTAFNYYKIKNEEINEEIQQKPYFLYHSNHVKIPIIMRFPSKETDNFLSLFYKFLSLYDLMIEIYSKNKNNLLKNSNFPLHFPENDLKVNSIINVSYLKVDAFQTQFKTKRYEKSILYLLFVYNNNLYFAESIEYNNSIIKYKFPLSQILIAEDRGEPRQLTLFINENTVLLEFKSPEKTNEIKLMLENASYNTLSSEYSLLELYFNQVRIEFIKQINYNKK